MNEVKNKTLRICMAWDCFSICYVVGLLDNLHVLLFGAMAVCWKWTFECAMHLFVWLENVAFDRLSLTWHMITSQKTLYFMPFYFILFYSSLLFCLVWFHSIRLYVRLKQTGKYMCSFAIWIILLLNAMLLERVNEIYVYDIIDRNNKESHCMDFLSSRAVKANHLNC